MKLLVIVMLFAVGCKAQDFPNSIGYYCWATPYKIEGDKAYLKIRGDRKYVIQVPDNGYNKKDEYFWVLVNIRPNGDFITADVEMANYSLKQIRTDKEEALDFLRTVKKIEIFPLKPRVTIGSQESNAIEAHENEEDKDIEDKKLKNLELRPLNENL